MISQLVKNFHSQKPLIIDDQGQIVFADFWQRVTEQYVYLKQQPEHRFALWSDDSYAFLSWLWAAILADKSLVLPPHRISQLEQDFAEQGIIFIDDHCVVDTVAQRIDHLDINWQQQLDKAQLIFFTSGSTGQPKHIPRSMRQLLTEVATLTQYFSFQTAITMLASVSHQHIYGILFKVLLPLWAGQSFYRYQLLYPEHIVQVQQRLCTLGQQHYLIASPALLKRCVGTFDFELSSLILSSGGQLDRGIRAYYPQPIVEILGSSETGGIAIRRQDDDVWQPMLDVDVRVDDSQQLWVKTAHAFSPDWIATGDLAKFNGKSLQLLGRSDRIVKLEEKRISLDQIEQTVLRLSQIAQCHVTLTKHQQRDFVSIVIVLHAQQRHLLCTQGKKAMIEQLKSQLQGQLESIAMPRLWRFVEEISRNTQAKISKQWIEQLFQPLYYPVIHQQQLAQDQADYRLEFIAEMACFKGHFKDFPVYPGVAQLGLMIHFSRQNWTDLQDCLGYEQLKFQGLIRPYDVLDLHLQRDGHKINFNLHNQQQQRVAGGRILFQLAGDHE
ncbi:AMP-binding protein [Acinetobacter qingfengensis]|uniref:Uncharacterized protein n=1 Tax=Acinetobacter qingfengensis TaxID=1262585 RepID=A0A1E7R2S9_9GAMM|nr:AMP-binding protein [Acinetobacter qingfengensis]KAA8733853.1 AMP-binding protein [Acinetobacter qingfengensis]OEY93634.1 hypothetical protein BJI46_04110 [Acinetobacter qingfengensis]